MARELVEASYAAFPHRPDGYAGADHPVLPAAPWRIVPGGRPNGWQAADEPMFRIIFEHAGVGIFRTSPDGRFLDANPALARMLGYDSPARLLREVDDIGRQIYVDAGARDQLMRALETDGSISGVVSCCRRRDGSLFWGDETASLVRDERGRPAFIVGSITDVTELVNARDAIRTAEADYRGLFEHATEGIYRSSLDGAMLRANPALVRLMGYEREPDLLAAIKDIASEWYVDPRRRADFVSALQEHGKVTDFVSEVYCHGTGERIWVSENARVIYGDDGRPLYYEGRVQDVTERRRAEEAVHRAVAEATASNRAKSEFLANMSHELRTPLNAIIGFSEVIRTDAFGRMMPETYRSYVDDIHGSGVHLLQLIEDILDVSKAEAGKLTLEETPVELGRVLHSAMQMMRERARRGCVRMQCETDGGLPLLRADRRRILQIAINLVSNAVKFTPAGGTVIARTGLTADGGLFATVEDTGVGIDGSQIDRVFDPFVQLNQDSRVASEGTGLGLPLTRKLVELHGGSLELISEPGHGTSVTVAFPPDRTLR